MEESTAALGSRARVQALGTNSSTSFQTLSSDMKDLRRVVDDIPPRLWAVAIIGFWERFAFWGMTAPWQNYMQNARHRSTGAPGALGLGQALATRIYCAFYILYYVTPLAFAIISDSYLGRFKTLCISVMLYVLGCGVLMGSSFEEALDAKFGLPGLIVAMILIALGGGGFKMLMVPFIADQYTPESSAIGQVKTLKSGERVLADRSLTLQYIYNMYYWVGNVGSLSWFATTIIEQFFSFTIAYSITFAAMVIAMLMLFLGTKWYIRLPHEGNMLPVAAKIMACACRNNFSMARVDPEYQLQYRGKTVAWTSQLVNELCRGLRACRVLISFVIFYICFDQMQNNLISQAKQMETHGVPNDMIPGLNQVACIVLGPILQYGLYPFLSKRRIHFKPIARITAGFAFIALSMLYATVLQHFIYSAPPCYNSPGNCLAVTSSGSPLWRGSNRVNVWIQTPVYVFIAIGELFAYVTAMEYAYDHSPRDMKAIVQAISLLVAGVGSACAMGLTPIARDPDVIILYGSLTGAMTVTTALFWWLFSKYDRLDTRGADHSLSAEMATSPNMNTISTSNLGTDVRRSTGTPPNSARVHIECTDDGLAKGIVVTAVAANGRPKTPASEKKKSSPSSMQKEGGNIRLKAQVPVRIESPGVARNIRHSAQEPPSPEPQRFSADSKERPGEHKDDAN